MINNKKIKFSKETTRMIFVTLGVFLVMGLLRPHLFFRSANFLSMGYQLPELGLYSLAMMLAMLSGGIDLSVVAIGNLSGIVAAKVLQFGVANNFVGGKLAFNIFLAVICALIIGVVCGTFNGILISKLSINPMLLTMASSLIIMGTSVLISKAKSVSGIPDCLLYVGSHTLLGIPYSLWLFILVLIFVTFLLNKHSFGFKLKMVGGNPVASKYSGINVSRIIIITYLLSGILSSLCGLEILFKTNAAKSDYASTYVLQAILCAVLGATDPEGGFAKVSCLVLSLFSLQFLSSGFNLLRLSGYYKDFSWGLLLLLVLSIDYFSVLIKNIWRKFRRVKLC